MAVKKKVLSGAELLTRLQGWLRRGWVEEHNTLGRWDTNGRRIKGRYYISISGQRFDDKECGPFPEPAMMVEIAGHLMRGNLGRDERWPRAMFTPAQSNNQIVIDIVQRSNHAVERGVKYDAVNAHAWERYSRLQTLEAWERSGRIHVSYFTNNQKDRSTAVVTFGQYERREDTADFPSPEMIANIALALGAGVDQQ